MVICMYVCMYIYSHIPSTLFESCYLTNQENKVNKDVLNKILELKADKTVVDQKVSQSNFDSVMINVERNLQCIIQKADEQVIDILIRIFLSIFHPCQKSWNTCITF